MISRRVEGRLLPRNALFGSLLPAISLLIVTLLGGCVEGFPEAQVGRGDVRNAVAISKAVSPRGATVSMTSLEGAPADVVARFKQVFARQAADREIAMADSASAHYLVRGYISAYASDSGTEVSYVYDIFDANDQQRVNRVADAMALTGFASDAWALVDDRVMASLAGRSADELASALAATPVAQAALAAPFGASTAPASSRTPD